MDFILACLLLTDRLNDRLNASDPKHLDFLGRWVASKVLLWDGSMFHTFGNYAAVDRAVDCLERMYQAEDGATYVAT